MVFAGEKNELPPRKQKPDSRSVEISGLLFVGFLLLVLLLVRYWRVIHWSLR